MSNFRVFRSGFLGALILVIAALSASAQTVREDEAFGPVVRAYLGYLRNEQEVVDDRVSRHEVNATYYRRNSNRIRALRQMAMHIARETQNDYLPELEAVAGDELGLLFERPPALLEQVHEQSVQLHGADPHLAAAVAPEVPILLLVSPGAPGG